MLTAKQKYTLARYYVLDRLYVHGLKCMPFEYKNLISEQTKIKHWDYKNNKLDITLQ